MEKGEDIYGVGVPTVCAGSGSQNGVTGERFEIMADNPFSRERNSDSYRFYVIRSSASRIHSRNQSRI
jgi:hypothetical protein